jgi:acyl-CoA oxidase
MPRLQLYSDGSLHRFMPPTIPAGTPCVAIVWARLKVGTEDRGIRPFIVPLNDGHNMCPGVVAK